MTRIFTGLYWRTRSGLFDQSLARNGFEPSAANKKKKKKKEKTTPLRLTLSDRKAAINNTINALVEMTVKGSSFEHNWGSVPRVMRAEIKDAGGIDSWLDRNGQRATFNTRLRKKRERQERRAAATPECHR